MRSYNLYENLNKKFFLEKKNWNPSFRKNKFNSILGLLGFCNKTGYKKKILNYFTKINIRLFHNYVSNEFNYNFTKNSKYKNINFLFDTIFKKSELNFKISCIEVNKKYRKKLKRKYTFKINYLNNVGKRLFFLKNFSHIIKKDPQKKITDKIINTFINILVDFKKSELYKLKILVLKRLTVKK